MSYRLKRVISLAGLHAIVSAQRPLCRSCKVVVQIDPAVREQAAQP
jgi:hypothetical protein